MNGMTIKTLEARQFFGEGALLTGEPRTADVFAMVETKLLVLHRNDFQRLLPLGFMEEIFDNQLKWEALHSIPALERLTVEQARPLQGSGGSGGWARR